MLIHTVTTSTGVQLERTVQWVTIQFLMDVPFIEPGLGILEKGQGRN